MDDQAGKPQSAVTWVRKNSKHRGSLKTVLIMLADFIDDGNNCPSQKELAEATGLSTDTVRRCLGELAKEKTITLTKSGGKKVKGGQRDCYAINGRGQDDAPVEAAPSPAPVTLEPTTTPDATGSQEPVLTEQHGRPIPPSTQPHGGNAVPHAHEGSDAATRVKDLSLEQEQKDRQTDSPGNHDLVDGEDDDGLSVDDRTLRDAYMTAFGPMNDDQLTELIQLAGYYAHAFVIGIISNGRQKISGGGTIDKPMSYIRQGLINMAGEGKIPHLKPLNVVSRSPSSGWIPSPASPASQPRYSTPAHVPIQDRPRLRADEIVDLSKFPAPAVKS